MREFVIEDQRSGSIVARGMVSPAGDVSLSETSMSADDQMRAIAQIQKDSASGHSGGRLDIHGLEWMEMMRRGDG